MKYRPSAVLVFACLLPLCSVTALSAAQEREQSDQAALLTAPGNYYAAGSTVDINREVIGDLIAAAGRISVERNVAKDAALVGGTIEVRAPVGEDLRVAGGNVTLDSRIGGELFAAGGTLRLSERSRVSASAMLAGADVKAQGRIDGDLGIMGGEILVNGSVRGNATLRGEHIVLGPLASISGDLRYASPNPLQRNPAARVAGSVTQLATPAHWKRDGDRDISVLAWLHPLFVVGLLLAGAVLSLIWPHALGSLSQTIRQRPLGTLLAGLALLFVIPPLIIVMMISVIGIPLALALSLLYPLFLLLAYLSAAFFIGKLLVQALRRDMGSGFKWQMLCLFAGLVVLALLTWVPFLNVLVMLLALSVGLGSGALWFYRRSHSDALDVSDPAV